MISLKLPESGSAALKVLCLGSHSDDIEIGCGGTVLRLLSDRPNSDVAWVVFSAAGEREREARKGAKLFLEGAARSEVIVGDFRDGYFQTDGARIKDFFEGLKRISPDLILTHNRHDAHQDHRTVAELTWNTFRNHLILEYEIPKYDGDMGQPNIFVPLTSEVTQKKVRCLMDVFESQRGKRWFQEEHIYLSHATAGNGMQRPQRLCGGILLPQADTLNMASETIPELWRFRELLYFFAWREVKVRYRQAAFGAAWAVIQPLANMIIFTLLFGRVARMPSDGIPYPIFCYCGLVPWTYFSTVVTTASNSLVSNDSLLTKVYFPRMLLPLGSAFAGLMDFGIGSSLLVALMFYYRIVPGRGLLLLPFFVLVMVLLTAGVSMGMAAANVRYRDVKYALPFLIQMWMFATPIIYPASVIPKRFQLLMALNPCWGIVDGFRACLFPQMPFDPRLIAISVAVAVVVFVVGAYYFYSEQKSFADVI